DHPGIVPVYGLGFHADGRPYFAMRFVEGETLSEAIRRVHASGPRFDAIEFRQLLRRFVDVCNTVAYAHSRGVIHCDIKPGNVLLGKYGETLLVDWGLAKEVGHPGGSTDEALRARAAEESSTPPRGHVVGTPSYMSPEQA